MSEKKKVISTPTHLRNEVEKLIGDAMDVKDIYNYLASSSYSVSPEAALNPTELRSKVEDTCKQYEPYEVIQLIRRNNLIMPLNRRSWFIWNEEDYRVHPVDKEVIVKYFNKKQDYLRNSKSIPVAYVPKQKYGLVEFNGNLVFNNYKPPQWLEHFFRHNKPIPVVTEVPELYHRFLMHLCDNDEASYNYVLDWLAISLQRRNQCYLTTVGHAGIGKGFLSKIIRALHGWNHFVEVPFSEIGSKFTNIFNEKTAIYLNEVSKMTLQEYSLLKQANDDTRKNEMKGVDAETVLNFSNIYISSNNMDAIRSDSDDRRLSIINLTSTKLERVFSQEDIHKLAPGMNESFTWLNEFGYYLMQRPYNPIHLTEKFESEQTKRIKDAAAYDWEKWIIDDFCKDFAGRTITCRAVSEYASTIFKKTIITEKSLKGLSEKFKGVFKVVKTELYEETAMVGNKPGFKISENENNKRLSCIRINKLKDQTNHEVREVEND